jgi:KDO2-lipid IV(A) lauroyltransferase
VQPNTQKQDSIRDWLEYIFVKTFLFFATILPKFIIYHIMRMLVLAFYHIYKRRREITINNLQQAFPRKSDSEIQLLSKKVYSELSKTIAEILLLITNRFDIDNAIANKEEALSQLAKLKIKYPKGWIFVTAHFSNWELLAKFLAKHGYSMLVIGREGDNKLIDHRITVPFREAYGNTTVYKKKAAVSIFKTLKRGKNVGILIDQKVYPTEAVKVKFFGQNAHTSPLVATMKQKLDIAIIPIFLPRDKDGKYHIEIYDATEYEGDIKEMTQYYNDIMEQVVRKYPAQWFWMHNRWKE